MARIIEQKIKIPLSEFILKSKEVSGEIRFALTKKMIFEINLESEKNIVLGLKRRKCFNI